MADQTYRARPHINYMSQPYWDASRERRLIAQRCDDCGKWFAPADAACPNCFSTNWTWQESTGKGTLYSFSAMHRVLPGYPSPTILAVVELDEGFTMFTNMVECDEHDLTCDMPVEVTYEDIAEDVTLPMFRPAP